MRIILDSIFPGLKFVVFGNQESRHTSLLFINDSDTIYRTYSDVQLDMALSKDSSIYYSDESVIKAFIYFDLILKQGTSYQGIDIQPSDIVISQCLIKYEGNEGQRMRKESQRINFKAFVKLEEGNIYYFRNGIKNPISIQYSIQLDEKFVTYFSRIIIDKLGKSDTSELIQFNAPYNMKYQKKRYEKIRNSIKGHSRSNRIMSNFHCFIQV